MKTLDVIDANGDVLARCFESSVNPDWFFDPIFENDAVKICKECPLVTQCLALALDEEIQHGVWGGLTEQNRKELLKKRSKMRNRKANK